MLPNRKTASASSGSVKRATAQEWETPKTDSAQRTLQDSWQLLLTHEPYLLKEAWVLKAWNQDLTVFGLDVYLYSQISYLKIDYENRIPLRKARRESIYKAHVRKRQLQSVQLSVRVRRVCNPQPLNSTITIQTSVHLNSTELHACNHHSPVRCEIDVSLHIHAIEVYSFQPQCLFSINIAVGRFIMNMWFNSVWFTRY